jgi:hypothetical protein
MLFAQFGSSLGRLAMRRLARIGRNWAKWTSLAMRLSTLVLNGRLC